MPRTYRLGAEYLFTGDDIVRGDLAITDGVVADVVSPRGGKGIASPGFVDLQVNGFAGVDFLSASQSELMEASQGMGATGVTSFQPTLISAEESRSIAALGRLSTAPLKRGVPRMLGIHLEGPFLSPDRRGAHSSQALAPANLQLLNRLLDAGRVTMVTLAPELPGALRLIRSLAERGIVVWAGHSDATVEAAARSVRAGVSGVTHIFNAMRPFHHREPGLAGFALATPTMNVGVIADGIHLAEQTLCLIFSAAPGRVVLVTDAIAAACQNVSATRLGDITVCVEGPETKTSEGRLAGSVQTMDGAVRTAVAAGVPLQEALRAASTTPAVVLQRPELASLLPSTPADIVLIDDDLEVIRTLCSGQDAF